MSDDETIRQYLDQMRAEAELARADLDEIEDHIRDLATELCARGVAPGEATALACRRVGDPRQIAREHARVRSPFGARLSRARAWSAALLLGAPALYALTHVIESPRAPATLVASVVAWLGVIGALALRKRWARPLALGFACACSVPLVLFHYFGVHDIATLGAVAFLMPWRRGEITRAALALVLLGVAYDGASRGVIFYGSYAFDANPFGVLAASLVMVAIAGVVLRRGWAIGAAAGAAAALAVAFQWTMFDDWFGPHRVGAAPLLRFYEMASVGIAIASALGAAFVARQPRVRALRTPAA